MPSAVPLRTDFLARELRRLAKESRDNSHSRRLLSLAAVLDGMSRDDISWHYIQNDVGDIGL